MGKKAEYGDQVVGYALEDYDDDLIVGMVNMKIIISHYMRSCLKRIQILMKTVRR